MDDREETSPSEDEDAALPMRGPIREAEGAVLLPALVAGAVAAALGGLAWGLIVKYSEYELGIVAWGIGLLAGAAVAFAARGARGPVLQAVAVLSALAGILLGKYLSFAWVIQDLAEEEGGDGIGILSGEMISLFRDNLDVVFSLFDLLWVGLAVFTAWRMLRPAVETPAPAE